MRDLFRDLADTIRWGEPWSFEEDDEFVILDVRNEEAPARVTPGAIIAF
ncbi:MAG: hypothetical protein ACLGHT_06455 [Acidimicrobiia bacterium]